MSYAVAVLSGGMDSTVLAYYATSVYECVDLVSVDYGQRHWIELRHAARTAAHLEARHDVVDLSGVRKLLGGSALTDDKVDVPHGHYAAQSMADTVVPNRNATLISVAYMAAVSRKADSVLIGVHTGDHFVYPDCRPDFVTELDQALSTGNEGYGQVKLLAPFVHNSKTDICRLGDTLDVRWTDTWSCYQGGARHCGRCGTCVERREAFRDAAVNDPTEYEDESFAFKTLDEAMP
jgi:7-cyano-7-deazaguanine synthase